MNKATTPKQVLIAAKWIIQNIGWQQHHSATTKHGVELLTGECSPDLKAVCLIGATAMIEADPIVRHAANNLLRRKISERSIVLWNDEPGRTKQQVIDLLDQVIMELPNG